MAHGEATQIPEIKKAIVELRRMSASEKIRQEAEYREKMLHDEASALILSISLDTFSTQNSKQVRNQLFEMEQISMERSGMDICSISGAA